jgi:hypothetical protein
MTKQNGQTGKRPMQIAIEEIVENANLLDAFKRAIQHREEFHLRVIHEPWVPLVIEVTAEGQVSVCHYVEVNGDLVCDPEMTFNPTGWRATSFTQGLVGYYEEVPRGSSSSDMEAFAQMWAMNLQEQGFTAEGVGYESLTHAGQLPKPKGLV